MELFVYQISALLLCQKQSWSNQLSTKNFFSCFFFFLIPIKSMFWVYLLQHSFCLDAWVIWPEIFILFDLLLQTKELTLKFVTKSGKGFTDVVCKLLVQLLLKVWGSAPEKLIYYEKQYNLNYFMYYELRKHLKNVFFLVYFCR